ncbi:hypothetical protein [Aquimarina aggregata]|uniref:hypothetical protein n=1 Tax=Aquimarina aggregata TaxID=1642818 RepID=UPI002491E98B|nr:hypothetical protein [Aquimarina aggregata]
MGKIIRINMQEIQLFRQEILTKTLSLVDEPYEKWRTFNNKINTTLFLNDESISNLSIELKENELPLLECKLHNSYVLVSTHRVFSILDSKLDEISFKDVDRFGNEFEKENITPTNDIRPQINKIILYNSDGKKFIFRIDSLYPAYFVKLLIHNLINYRKNGVFSWK